MPTSLNWTGVMHEQGPSSSEESRRRPGQAAQGFAVQARTVWQSQGSPQGQDEHSYGIDRELRRLITVTEDGKPRRMTTQEVIIRRLAHEGIKGRHQSTELLMRLAGIGNGEETQAVNPSQSTLPDKDALMRIMKRLKRLVPEE